MAHKTLDFRFELKAPKDDGTFEGYGSVFNIVDGGDDIVLPGAFTESLAAQKAAGRLPAMLWQHRQAEPMGVYTSMEEDAVGLKVVGQLALKTARGGEAYELMKMGALSGMSIGYMTRDDSWDRVTGVRSLKKLDLYEVSLVTFPMNDASRVSSVKSIETLVTIRDAEDFLRESGLSRSAAVAFIARVKSLGQSDSDEGGMQQIVEALKRRSGVFAA
ncbi:MAG: HK97 family phage prohead protease [Burkholderiaceae bacterium]|nr:HK97 family phage prohead protease [Burkholderiaceae bacterium]